MILLAGPVWRSGRFEDGWLAVEDGEIVEAARGAPPRTPNLSGVIVPSPVNAHTHVGDALARGRDVKGMSLADLVAPPDGLKHRILREATDEQVARGIAEVAREMTAHGTRRFVDFREMGARGLRQLERGVQRTETFPVSLARPADPATASDAEIETLLEAADGLALSGLADVPYDHALRLSRAARAAGKRFAMHFSEGKREDLEQALDLRPWHLVHAVYATRADLERIAAHRLPIVLCPRSNAFFGKLPDVPGMVAAGVLLALGTDNAMLQRASVFDEMRFLAERFPEIPKETVLTMGLDGGRALLFGESASLTPGEKAEITVLSHTRHTPTESVLSSKTEVLATL